jgi:hypothetical protein
LLQQIGVRRCVDFALQNLLGAFDRQRCDLAAQPPPRFSHLLCCVSLGLRNDARCFGLGVLLDFVSDHLGALLGVANALLTFVASTGQLSLHALSSGSHCFLALVGGSQTIRDLLGALVERIHQRRPHEFHRKTGEDEEDNELRNQSCI